MKRALLIFLTILLIVFLVFGIRYCSLETNKFFAPQERALERKVFKESEQYNDSMIRELSNLQVEYAKATKEQKETLRAVILHKFSVYDNNKLPIELQRFYSEIKGF